ncbi:Septation protein imp2 [Hypsizygus marmoreus]|uniref:Septation protein imp2 n=1 Tax=Hypsizygus marmoreus TaxID=39966 RepID=A0A369K2E3_HYPMA|nr:Septation protein imp2 [Hypsizygus marmoreus]
MAVRAQTSTTSLSQYATNGDPTRGDPYNGSGGGSTSRDFCNSFWGPGDDGVNILFSRMRGATKTTDELRHFWSERAAIEEQYATRLAALSKAALGGDEIGDLRHSLDTLRAETEKQAQSHSQLAAAIRTSFEAGTSVIHAKQVNHRRNVQAAVEKKFKAKQTQESYVSKAKEKYDGDCLRIASYTQQSSFAQGKDLERIQLKLKRAQQTVQANEKDLGNFTKTLLDMMPGWEADWKDFCDACQDLEEDRMEFMKDTLWNYANEVSILCVNDDQSCERIRTVLDQLETERDLDNFVADYGTGSLITDPQTFIPFNTHDPTNPQPAPVTRHADFTRTSRSTRRTALAPAYQPSPSDLHGEYLQHEVSPDGAHTNANVNGYEPPSPNSQTQAWQHSNGPVPPRSREEPSPVHSNRSQQPPTAPPSMAPPPAPVPAPAPAANAAGSRSNSPRRRYTQRQSQPLPTPGLHHQYPGQQEQPPMPTPPPPPPPPTQETGGILFYVKALYDYTATIDEEFDFQAGDVIAVTATPDDGWWSGELLDEARREEGRHVFPSNFVCLF